MIPAQAVEAKLWAEKRREAIEGGAADNCPANIAPSENKSMTERDDLALVLANAQRVRNGSPKLLSADQCSRIAFDDADAVLAAGYRKVEK